MAPNLVHGLFAKQKMACKWLVRIFCSPKTTHMPTLKATISCKSISEKTNGQWVCPRKERKEKKTRRHFKNQHGRHSCRCKLAINKQTTLTKGNQNKQIRRQSPWTKEKHVMVVVWALAWPRALSSDIFILSRWAWCYVLHTGCLNMALGMVCSLSARGSSPVLLPLFIDWTGWKSGVPTLHLTSFRTNIQK